MMTEIALTETGRWFVANRGRAMALVVIGVHAGTTLLPVLVVLLREMGDWRLPWIAAALVLVLVGLPGIVGSLRVERIPRATEDQLSAGRMGRDWSRHAVIRDPILFHQGYLITLRGYDPLVFAGAFPVLAATTVVFGLVCGQTSRLEPDEDGGATR